MTASLSVRHVLAELERLDVLLRVQAWRVRAGHGDDPELAGLYAPDTEPDTLLDRPLGTPPWAARALSDEMRAVVSAALDRCAAEVQAREREAAEIGTELRLASLAAHFGLTRFDVDVVLTCLAPELDRRYERLYGYLHDDVTRRRPSVDLVLALFLPDLAARVAARARFDPAAPLLRFRLVELGDEPEQSSATLLGRTVRLDPRIAAHLLDDDALDVRLRPVVDATTGRRLPGLPDEAQRQLARLAEHTDARPLTVYCRGDDGGVRRSAFAAFGAAVGRGVFVVDGARVAEGRPGDVALVAALADREARLRHELLCWDAVDALLADERRADLAAVRGVVAARDEVTLVGGAVTWEPVDAVPAARFLTVELPMPGVAERERLWRRRWAPRPERSSTCLRSPRHSAWVPGGSRTPPRPPASVALGPGPDPARAGVDRPADRRPPALQPAPGRAGPRDHPARRLGRPRPARRPHGAAARDRRPGAPPRDVLDDWGFGGKLALGKGVNVAVRRAVRAPARPWPPR